MKPQKFNTERTEKKQGNSFSEVAAAESAELFIKSKFFFSVYSLRSAYCWLWLIF